MHLRVKRYDEAIELLRCSQAHWPENPARGYIQDACAAIKQGHTAVEKFLVECEKVSRSTYKLDK